MPGVGEKTAAKLITTYGGLDGIFAHLDEQTPKLRQNLAEHEAQVRQNAEVMVLLRDVPLDVDLDDLDAWATFDADEVRQLFDFLEFRTLLRPPGRGARRRASAPAGGAAARCSRPRSTALDATAAAVAALDGAGRRRPRRWPSPPRGSGAEGRSPLEGLALVTDAAAGDVAWIPAAAARRRRGRGRPRRARRPPSGRPLAAHDAKALMRSLDRARRRRARARRSTP